MTKRDESKVALVTGGSRGLGRNTSLHLARRGVGVILTYRKRRSSAESTLSEIAQIGAQAAALRLDVGDTGSFAGFGEQMRSTLQAHWQRESFDFLVNNAGIGIEASFAETSEAQFAELLNVHFRGPFFLTQTLLPLLADGGRIVNVSSGLARFTLPGFAAYAAMKGALEVLSRYLAKELGGRGISASKPPAECSCSSPRAYFAGEPGTQRPANEKSGEEHVLSHPFRVRNYDPGNPQPLP